MPKMISPTLTRSFGALHNKPCRWTSFISLTIVNHRDLTCDLLPTRKDKTIPVTVVQITSQNIFEWDETNLSHL